MKKVSVKDIFMYVLGALIVVGTFALIVFLIIQPNADYKDVLVMAVGTLIASFSLVVGYFYGSSKGSADKQDSIDRKLNGTP
jgi:succinate dehydrogenase hydrophobic anchor subunit